MTIRQIIVGLAFGAACSAAGAHDTWLIPESFAVPVSQPLELHLTSGARFDGPSILIEASRVQRAFGRVGDEPFLVTDFTTEAKSLALRYQPESHGIAVVAVDLKPKKLILDPGKIAEYLDDIDASDKLRERWKNFSQPRQWSESYVKHAKAFIRFGDCTGDQSWSTPLNTALEIVPDNDPTTIKVKDRFSVRVLKSGVPVRDFSLGCVSKGESQHQVLHTDAAGRAIFTLGAPGVWLIHGTDLRPSTEAGLEWESDFSTMVVEVQG